MARVYNLLYHFTQKFVSECLEKIVKDLRFKIQLQISSSI